MRHHYPVITSAEYTQEISIILTAKIPTGSISFLPVTGELQSLSLKLSLALFLVYMFIVNKSHELSREETNYTKYVSVPV